MLVFASAFSTAAGEDHSPAVIENLFAAPLPAATNALPVTLPALQVQAYRIESDTVLPPAGIGMLSNYTGRVDMARVRQGLDKLQALYRRSGHPAVTVTLPEQTLTNGLVMVKIIQSGAETESDPGARKQKTHD